MPLWGGRGGRIQERKGRGHSQYSRPAGEVKSGNLGGGGRKLPELNHWPEVERPLKSDLEDFVCKIIGEVAIE